MNAGLLLISDPFLKDQNFLRTVVLVCEHQPEGSIGFVLNKKYKLPLNELLEGLEDCSLPVYYGGPVQTDSIHFLHQRPDLIADGFEITNNIYWGGNFEQVKILLKENLISEKDIRFYIGYSGWGETQLENEVKEKSWITRVANNKIVFNKNVDNIWKDALAELGGEYELMVNYPLDPQFN